MFSLKTHATICAGLFGAMIGLAIFGNVLQAAHVIGLAGAGLPAAITFFALFAAFGFSCIPVMVKLVFTALRRGADPAATRGVETVIILTMWALIAAGLAIAIPAAIADGAFSQRALLPAPPPP